MPKQKVEYPHPKPNGWKEYSSTLWINDKGKHGCRYKCKYCGCTTLGTGDPKRHHHTSCEHHPDQKLAAEREGKPYKIFRLTAEVTVSVHTRVRARDEAEARTIVDDKATGRSMCHSCTHEGEIDDDPEWILEEMDGEPKIVEVTCDDA